MTDDPLWHSNDHQALLQTFRSGRQSCRYYPAEGRGAINNYISKLTSYRYVNEDPNASVYMTSW